MPFVDRKTAAGALGISRQRIEKLIKDGRIVEEARGIDLDRAERDYEASLDPAKRAAWLASRRSRDVRRSRREGDEPDEAQQGDLLSFADARTAKERAHAKRAELEYQIKRGFFLPRDEVAAKEFAIARKMRDRILGFPSRLASIIPADSMKILTDECEALVRELQDDAATIAETTQKQG